MRPIFMRTTRQFKVRHDNSEAAFVEVLKTGFGACRDRHAVPGEHQYTFQRRRKRSVVFNKKY
jgi:hypothetical protein